jgi:gliding motility-associated-like protein
MDTIQCLTGNLFKFFDGTTFDNVVNTAVMRTWYFGPNDSSTITRPTKVYPTAGRRRIFFRSEVLFKNAPTGCTDTTSLYIEVLPDPSSGGGVNDSLQCLADNNFIFDNTAKNITSYKWKFSSTDEVTTKSASRSFSAPGIYHVEHSATTNIGCQSRDTITVIVKPNTDASFTVSDPFVCQFDPLVDLTPVDPSGIFYGKHLVDDKQFDPVLPGYYPIKHVVTDTFCPDSQTLVIQVVTAPVFSLGNDTSVCNGNTFTVNISEPGTVVWHDGDVNKTRNFNNSGDYWATLSDSGCSYSDTVNLFVGNTPVVNWPFDTIICKKEILRLEVPKPPGTTLQWSTGSTESIVYINGPGTYTVTATNGCGKTIGTIIVAALDENCDMFIPTAFTPDGSGKNETWKLVERRDLTYMKFLIYDRWGTIVYDAMKTGKYEWDGSYMGRQVMQGIYHYVVIYETGEGDARRRGSVKGYINLIR